MSKDLDPKSIDKLRKKLEAIVLHLVSLKRDKKLANSGFKEQIDEATKKMNCIAQALQSGDSTFLAGGFSEHEIQTFFK